MQAESSFRVALAGARAVEIAVAAWLMDRGHLVLPVYDYSGAGDDKAPRLHAFSCEDSLVLPDLLVCRAGLSQWVEVKYKTAGSATAIRGNQIQTGISLRLYQQYDRVARESGFDVWMCFAHRTENLITLNSLKELRNLPVSGPPRKSSGPDRGGSVFWPLEELRVVASFGEVVRT